LILLEAEGKECNPSMFSIDGLASGLDTTSIIEGLLSLQQTRVDQLNLRKQEVIGEQSAFKGIEAKLLGLSSAIAGLSRSVDNVLEQQIATVSDSDLVSAAATDEAAAGVYNIRVDALARAHQIASQGYASAQSLITEGTLTIQVGSGTASTITVDGTNNTLQGLVDAINASDAEVTASIINDGSGSTPFRLLLTSDNTGAANVINITNNLAASSGDAVQPDFSGTAVQTAADATVTIGSGVGAISVSSTTNEIDDLITGVTLKLLAADATKDVTITVSDDTESAQAAIEDFVGAYNDLMKYIDDQVRFNAESDDAGTLLGDRSVIAIQDEIRLAVTSVVAGVNSDMNRLSALGISVNDLGHLVVNSSQLGDALGGRVDGVSMEDVKALFALTGTSDNTGIQFVLGGTDTRDSTVPYEVDITQAAERASITATNALAVSTVIDGSNDTLAITIDGQLSGSLTLAHGTYTRQELADHLDAVIDADSTLGSRSVTVSLQSNALKITSDVYGSHSEATIGTGNALTTLGFDGTETGQGQDVAGKFIVDGSEETVNGTGQLLLGDSSNDNTAGLQARVTLTSSQLVAGSEANLTVRRGIASSLDEILGNMLDPVTGQLKTISDGFNERIDSIDGSIERVNDLIDARRDSLIQEFAALEVTISQLQTTSNFLAAQLTSLVGLSSLSQSG